MPQTPQPIWVDTQESLDRLITEIRKHDRIAMDTEFHGERTYIPRLMLVQLATPDAIFLVDPLADLDMCSLFEAFNGDAPPLVIGHALHNDLEIIYLRCGRILPRVFDTQIAASFLGHGLQVGLANLVHRICGERLPKDGQMADWSRRPLSDKLKCYAANDVRYLMKLHDELNGALQTRGRDPWVAQECSRLSDPTRYERNPDLAYKRVGRYRTLKDNELGVLAAIAAERDRIAAEVDTVPHFLVPDDLLVAMARGAPQTRAELKSHRRLNHRQVNRHADRWLAAVRRGMDNPIRLPKARPPTTRGVEAAGALVMLLVGQLARENDIAPQLLLKRAVAEQALRDEHDDRESLLAALGLQGWRSELIGESLWKLVRGELHAHCQRHEGEVVVAFGDGKPGSIPDHVIADRRNSSNGKSRRRRRRRRKASGSRAQVQPT